MQSPLNASDVGEARLWARLAFAGWADNLGVERRARRMNGALDDIKTLCLFIGYPRSGHSLVSSVLDAHRNAAFSHRLNSLKYLSAGRSERALFYLILRNARRFAGDGRRLTGYQYDVPGQHQGAVGSLTVIGDQEGKDTTEALAEDPELLDELNGLTVDVKYIHAVRNPFDNISTWATRTHRGLEHTADRYFALCRANRDIRAALEPDSVFDIHHERFLAAPRNHLIDLCGFLGLEAEEGYLADCVGIMYDTPNRSRERAPWTRELIGRIEAEMTEFDFLDGYSYDS